MKIYLATVCGGGRACTRLCLWTSGGDSAEPMFLLCVLLHFWKDPSVLLKKEKTQNRPITCLKSHEK